jgi:hypothetical protein
MGDRFIPFRGNSDNFFLEEFILNNDDPFKCNKKLKKKNSACGNVGGGSGRQGNESSNMVGTSISNDIIVEDVETELQATH